MKTKQELEVSELRFRTVFEQAPIGIVITDNHRMLYTNSVFENILGMSKTQLKEVDWADLTHPDDLQADIDKFDLLRAGLIDDYSLVKRFIRADGSVVWVDMIIASMRNGNLLEDCHLCMVQDISERKEWEDKIVYLNYHDVLTGLYNRTFFDEELLKADKPEMMPVSLIIGDIDGLKIINDAFGHDVGDAVLVEVGKALDAIAREGEIVARTRTAGANMPAPVDAGRHGENQPLALDQRRHGADGGPQPLHVQKMREYGIDRCAVGGRLTPGDAAER